MKLTLWKIWLLSFLGLFLLNGAWSVSAPYDALPDERAHVYRAAGVAAGDVVGEPTFVPYSRQTVPEGYTAKNTPECAFQFKEYRSAECAASPSADGTPVAAETAAGKYNPVYYAITGWPLWAWPGWSGLIIARLISAMLSALVLAGALSLLMRWSRYGLLTAATVLTITPAVTHYAGSINPSGLELAAGSTFFSVAIPLLSGKALEHRRAAWWLLAISGALLVTLRSAGPVLLAIGAVGLLLPLGWRQIKELLRDKAFRWVAGGIAVAAMLSAAWIVGARATSLVNSPFPVHLTMAQRVFVEISMWPTYLDQMIGIMSWNDTRLAGPFITLWIAALLSLVLFGLTVASRRQRWQMLLLGLGIPLAMSGVHILKMDTSGVVMQGRYMMPVLIAVPLIGAFALEEQALSNRHSATLGRLLLGLFPLQALFLFYTMARWQRGVGREPGTHNYPSLDDFSPFGGTWEPPLGSVLPAAMSVVGAALIVWLIWPRHREPATP